MNIKTGILNVPKHDNKQDLIHFMTKRRGSAGINNNNIEENGKDYQPGFDTDSSALCPHFKMDRMHSQNNGVLRVSLQVSLLKPS